MCEVMAGVCESDRTDVLSNSLKTINDETLITELIRRGYVLANQRDNETTGEIVKIS